MTDSIVTHVLAPLLEGEEGTDIERLWRRLYTRPYKLGPTGAQLEAMAGVDIAFWDLLGYRSTGCSAAATGRPPRSTPARCRAA